MSAKIILKPRSLSQFIVVIVFLMAAMLMTGYIALGNLSQAEKIFWSTTQFMVLFFILVLIWVYMTTKR